MRSIGLISVLATLLIASSALGQNQPRVQQPPPPTKPGPYKPVAISPPKAISEATFEAFRKQINEAAQRKDREALTKLVIGQGFFWLGEKGDRADKRKSGVDNLAAALGLNSKDGAGWDMLASFAEDPTGSPLPEHKGTLCAPADPTFDGKAFNDLMQATQTDPGDWAYPVADWCRGAHDAATQRPGDRETRCRLCAGHAGRRSNIPTFLRVVTPAGKTGYVLVDSVAPIGNDQICYVKDASGWKIGGYIGGAQ